MEGTQASGNGNLLQKPLELRPEMSGRGLFRPVKHGMPATQDSHEELIEIPVEFTRRGPVGELRGEFCVDWAGSAVHGVT